MGSLLMAARLQRKLAALSDSAIGHLMFAHVWNHLNLLSPEMTICQVATERLLNSSSVVTTKKGESQPMKKAAIYVRVSTPDQHVESQLYDLRELAAQRGFEVVHEYEDRGVCGKKARRPGLDALMADARRKKFSVVLVAAFDRIARSTRNFLQVDRRVGQHGRLSSSLGEKTSIRAAPMGRLFVTIISAIAELERSLVVERVKSWDEEGKT